MVKNWSQRELRNLILSSFLESLPMSKQRGKEQLRCWKYAFCKDEEGKYNLHSPIGLTLIKSEERLKVKTENLELKNNGDQSFQEVPTYYFWCIMCNIEGAETFSAKFMGKLY